MVVTNADQKINELFKNIKETLKRAIDDPANKLSKEIVLKELLKGKYPHEIAADHNNDLNNKINNLSDPDKKNLAKAYKNRPTEEYLPDEVAQEINNNKDLKNNIENAQKDRHPEENQDDQNKEDEQGEEDENDDEQEDDEEKEEDEQEDDEDQDDNTESEEDGKNEEKGDGKDSGGDGGAKGSVETPTPGAGGVEAASNAASTATGAGATGATAAGGASAAGATAAAAPAAVPTIVVIVIVIIVVIVIMIIMAGCSSGRKGNVQASPSDNATDFSLVTSMSKIQELQKSLSENIDIFLKNIEEIKSLEGEKTKPNPEIIKLCNDIITKATELKSLSAAGVEGGDPEKKGRKEQLNIEIMDLVKKMVPMLYSSTPCFNQPGSGYCGQTSTMMLICTYNPSCGIKKDSSFSDYARLGSTSTGSSLIGLIQRNLPGKKIVQVNTAIGEANPKYEPLFEQAKKGNPVVIGTKFPPNASYMHYVVVTGYAGEKNGERYYKVNNPYSGGCQSIELSESYFKKYPYPGPDYWYMYVE